ncbi:unnamed protein product [Blepharisma stoltei]|uniref:chitin synthase n=1 Tax=Blepharisma stoltei TaxID=1481888 RepID=A0AAU9IUK4_9CILI|nr:unnamed protein product [Blepharisma stoltei]
MSKIIQSRSHKEIISSASLKAEIIYQPLKLQKKMIENFDEKQSKRLECVNGLVWIDPDTNFRESFCKDLIYNTQIEFLIVVAMYNESKEHLTHTLNGISENLEEFKCAGIPPERVCTIIIVDGMEPFLKTFYKPEEKFYFEQFFDEKKIKDFFKVENLLDCKIPEETEDDEFAHCFMKTHYNYKYKYGMQTIFCVKQKNRRKLNTHLWFFGGFCEMFQPKYVMLLDVGTKPLPKSLFYLYEAMEEDGRIAGCCGEITPMEPNVWSLLQMAQMVEYKISHIFDKALESVIGYITVLPGAFSAYRWKALQGDPLWEFYFKSFCHPEKMDAFHSNIYLAEDRVLCLALVSKKNNDYLLRYVKKSVAETDVPDKLSVLMAQRRRWINGSWFALIDTLRRASSLYHSNHSRFRKCLFFIQMVYYAVNVACSWFSVGAFFLAFNISMRNYFDGNSAPQWIGNLFVSVYVTAIILIIFLSLGVKPRKAEDVYKVISYCYGLFMVFTIAMMIIFLYHSIQNFNWFLPLIVASFFIFGITMILNCAALKVVKGVVHFILLSPTYINVFLIYAICNFHDCTWGNRPDQMTVEEKNKLEEFEAFRTRWASVWALCNLAFVYYLNIADKESSENRDMKWFIYSIGFIGFGILAFRFIGAMLYLMQEHFCTRIMKPKSESDWHINEEKEEIVLNHKEASIVPSINYEKKRSSLISEENHSERHMNSIETKENQEIQPVYKFKTMKVGAKDNSPINGEEYLNDITTDRDESGIQKIRRRKTLFGLLAKKKSDL